MREYFIPIFGKRGLHEININKGIRRINFVISKNPIVMNAMPPYRKIDEGNLIVSRWKDTNLTD